MKYTFSDNKDINQTLNKVVQSVNKLADQQHKHIVSLTRIGLSLSSATELASIFDMILVEAIAFTKADAATIYQVSEDLKSLNFEIVYNKTLNMRMGGTHSTVSWSPVPLYDKDGNPDLTHIVTNVYHTKRIVAIDDVYATTEYDTSGTRATDKNNNYHSKSVLTIPLKNHEDDVLGVIQVFNAMDDKKKVIPFNEEHKLMLNSLASQAAIALSNRKLINDLESLLMQFIKSIAVGIERKSKYSSNHITRVAALTDFIAQKVNSDTGGYYKNQHFSPNELKELSLAGWMHDVGKIITPEAVMDKATKLETIVDRIELIKLRFQVFRNALKLYCQEKGEKAVLELTKDWFTGEAPTDMNTLLSRLDEELKFLEKGNFGGEFVNDADLERIRKLGSVSMVIDGEETRLLTDNEVYNLQIRRGTLTFEEKKQMDDHVSVTWEMLSQLKFPKKYRNVALYASSHHEKLNGKGYPKGLTAEQLPLQSRILAVADIYEALTAADRPYKKAKTLSESMKIMAFMIKDGDLDGTLLDFFLDSGAYLEFAEENMKQEQIDQVDIMAIKKIYHPELNQA